MKDKELDKIDKLSEEIAEDLSKLTQMWEDGEILEVEEEMLDIREKILRLDKMLGGEYV